MVRAPKGDLETSSKVTSRPSEHSALPVSCWLSPGWCTCARCSARPRTVCSVHQTVLTSTAGLFLENTQFFIFSSLKYWRFWWNKRVRNRDASEGQMVRMLQKWEEGDQRGEAHLNLSNNRLLATNGTAIGCTSVEKKQNCDRRLPKSSRTFKPSGICCFFHPVHPTGSPRDVLAFRKRVRGLFLEGALSQGGGGGEGILDKLIIILSNWSVW